MAPMYFLKQQFLSAPAPKKYDNGKASHVPCEIERAKPPINELKHKFQANDSHRLHKFILIY
jgi:hypothetical protein